MQDQTQTGHPHATAAYHTQVQDFRDYEQDQRIAELEEELRKATKAANKAAKERTSIAVWALIAMSTLLIAVIFMPLFGAAAGVDLPETWLANLSNVLMLLAGSFATMVTSLIAGPAAAEKLAAAKKAGRHE